MPDYLLSSIGLRMTVEEAVNEIIGFMRADLRRRYRVMIGTDSEQLADNEADFVTAVVVHRVGNGGRYFWRRVDAGKVFNLRDRIIKEVLISLDVAKCILTELKKFPQPSLAEASYGGQAQPSLAEASYGGQALPDFDFEIHADVGANGPTSPMIQEVVAMIRANNFAAKTKPESCAASNVADRHI
jgi:hypothetical protein